MDITIQNSGYVVVDSMTPFAYAGEMNSRILNITHPTYSNAIYQLIVVKEHRPYILSIIDGKCLVPPSITDIACILNCQFIAARKDENSELNDCDCYPSYSNDCSQLLFKSDSFKLKVGEGLNLNGLTPIPPYEQLMDMYNNLTKAKLSVEQAKADNELVATAIDEKIKQLQSQNYIMDLTNEASIRAKKDNELEKQVDSLMNNYKDKKQIFIESSLNGNAIIDINGNIVLTQSTELNVVNSLQSDMQLIIPMGKSLIINNITNFNVEGKLEVIGSLNLINSFINVSGYVYINDSNKSIIYNNSKINVHSGGKILIKNKTINDYEEFIGTCSINLDEGSYLTYFVNSNSFNIEMFGNGNIESANILDMKKDDTIKINGTLKVNGSFNMNDDSKIMIGKDSICIVDSTINSENSEVLHFYGDDYSSTLKITNNGKIEGFESGKEYYFEDNSWVEII